MGSSTGGGNTVCNCRFQFVEARPRVSTDLNPELLRVKLRRWPTNNEFREEISRGREDQKRRKEEEEKRKDGLLQHSIYHRTILGSLFCRDPGVIPTAPLNPPSVDHKIHMLHPASSA
jgi:hypothetical protein